MNINLKEFKAKLTPIHHDPETRSFESKVTYLPDFERVFKDLKDSREGLKQVISGNKEDGALKEILHDLNRIFNKYRTHLRRYYPQEYSQIKRVVGENFEAGEGEQYATKNFIKKKKMKEFKIKKIELRKLIREEIKQVIKEDFYRGNVPQFSTPESINNEDDAYEWATQIIQNYSEDQIPGELFDSIRDAIQDSYFEGEIKTSKDIEDKINQWIEMGIRRFAL